MRSDEKQYLYERRRYLCGCGESHVPQIKTHPNAQLRYTGFGNWTRADANGNAQQNEEPEPDLTPYSHNKPRFIQCRCGFTCSLPSQLSNHLETLGSHCEPLDDLDDLDNVNLALAKLKVQLRVHKFGVEFCERESLAWSRIASFRSRRDKKRESEAAETARPCCKCHAPTNDVFMGKHTCASHFGGVAQMRLLEASLLDKDDDDE